MAEFDWTAFLGEWSRELIASQEIAAQLPPEVKAAGWLGYAGASEEQIAHAEARLRALVAAILPGFSEVLKRLAQHGFLYRPAVVDR